MPDRAETFAVVRAACDGRTTHDSDRARVVHGDALEVLRSLPDNSISLVLTDPPYHSTKKENIFGDTAFAVDEDYLAWLGECAREWQRVLQPNGSLYVFCASEMSARIEVLIASYLKPLNHITWTKPNAPGYDGWKGKMRKESLRRWYPHSERILYFEQASPGHARRSTLGAFLRTARLDAGLSSKELTEAIGAYGRVNNGGAVSNWETGRNIPSVSQYARIVAALEATGRVGPLPAYEDVVRPFNVSGDVQFTDVWDFESVRPYDGKHPAEKPQDLLRHAIEAATWEGDIVLDCFAGSGSTGVASLATGRLAICVEIEERWAERAAEHIASAERASTAASAGSMREIPQRSSEALPLFD